MREAGAVGRTGVNLREVIHRSSSFPQACGNHRLWITQWIAPSGESYFHWVETPNPAAMKPKPTTMFQLSRASIGSVPSVT